jgi:hypothetical protein
VQQNLLHPIFVFKTLLRVTGNYSIVGKSVLTHMNHVLPHKNSQKPKKKFYFIFSNFSWPKKKCVLAHKFSNILWFYHTFSVVKTHKNNVLPHKKYLFLIINLKFYIQNFFKNVSFNQIK